MQKKNKIYLGILIVVAVLIIVGWIWLLNSSSPETSLSVSEPTTTTAATLPAPVTGPSGIGQTINDSIALNYIFGNYDSTAGTSDWTPTSADSATLSSLNYTYDPSGGPLAVSAYATSSTATTYSLITSASSCEAHVCGAVVGGYLFDYNKTAGWSLVAGDKAMDVLGQFGTPSGDVTALNLGNGTSGFELTSGYMDQGVSSGGIYVFAPVGTEFKEVLSYPDASGDNSGIVDPNDPSYYSYDSTIAVQPAAADALGDIVITTSGTKPDDTTGNVQTVHDVSTFHFSGSSYVLETQ